jgi:hypothetical protein
LDSDIRPDLEIFSSRAPADDRALPINPDQSRPAGPVTIRLQVLIGIGVRPTHAPGSGALRISACPQSEPTAQEKAFNKSGASDGGQWCN